MNKGKINSKIEDLEAELQKLKKLANEPKQRTPEVGDVWTNHEGNMYILSNNNNNTLLNTWYSGTLNFCTTPMVAENGIYLGKFDEVYVKISDVRDAVVSYSHQGSTVMSTEALCDLNIITY